MSSWRYLHLSHAEIYGGNDDWRHKHIMQLESYSFFFLSSASIIINDHDLQLGQSWAYISHL